MIHGEWGGGQCILGAIWGKYGVARDLAEIYLQFRKEMKIWLTGFEHTKQGRPNDQVGSEETGKKREFVREPFVPKSCRATLLGKSKASVLPGGMSYV